MLYNIESKDVNSILRRKNIIRKRQGLVGDHFTDPKILEKLPGILLLDTTDILQPVKPHYEIFNLFCNLHMGGLSVAHNGNLTNALFKRFISKRRSYFSNY